MKKTLLFIGILIIALVIVLSYFFIYSRASSDNQLLDVETATSESNIEQNETMTDVSLYKNKGYLYKTKNKGAAGAIEFLEKNPLYQEDSLPSKDVKGASTLGVSTTSHYLLPTDFSHNSFLTKAITDRNQFNQEHFFFQQTLADTPIYGAVLAVHFKNDDEVYAVIGNLVNNNQVEQEIINQDEAGEIALSEAKKEVPSGTQLKIISKNKYIINKKILGLSDDPTNYLTLAVTIISLDDPVLFFKRYYVDLSTGNIIYQESLIRETLQRIIYNCAGQTASCPSVRGEGSAPVNDSDVDNSYNYLGETYQYYLSAFNRDSYDGQGGVLGTAVHFSSTNPQIKCPNVFWIGDPDYVIVACDGMVAKDVYTHELTHGVVEKTAQLIIPNQSGALNEGLADVFAYGLDNNWTMGEDTILGIIRYMNDPTQTPANVGGPQPDRLFSPYYYCGEQDSGGVHKNNGVINKTFYLMVDGGNFNGCTITGIGKDKSLAIIYRALITYLTPTSNFKSLFTAALQACNDLYQSEPNTCNQVKSAFESTEMDQQSDSGQKSPICSGSARQIPVCALAPSPTTNPNCSCDNDTCSLTNCAFDKFPDVSYPAIKCSLPSFLFSSTPTSSNKNSWCQASKRTKGDADANNIINTTDYFYYVAAFNGGKIPMTVNPDFNGDGEVLPTDREIIIKSLQ